MSHQRQAARSGDIDLDCGHSVTLQPKHREGGSLNPDGAPGCVTQIERVACGGIYPGLCTPTP